MADLLEFDPYDPAPVVGQMEMLALTGKGWINFHPGVAHDTPVPAPGMFGNFFSGRGPAVPLGTWVARDRSRSVEYRSVGIQHAAGPKAVARLADDGIALPEQTLVLADHPRRGLVVAFSMEAGHDAVLQWLLVAIRSLSTLPLQSPWGATIEPG